jgi:hypothetical protein
MSQEYLILRDLKRGHKLTPLDALRRYGCFRLSGRIYDLRKAGHRIEIYRITDGDKTFARYRLVRKKKAA